jgi:hypothetical protein
MVGSGFRFPLKTERLTLCRYWGAGLGFAVFFMASIDMLHHRVAPMSSERIPRVSTGMMSQEWTWTFVGRGVV